MNDLILDHKIDLFLNETWLVTDALAVLTEHPHQILFFYSLLGGIEKALEQPQFKKKYADFQHHPFVFSNPPILCITIYRPLQYTSFISEISELLATTRDLQ